MGYTPNPVLADGLKPDFLVTCGDREAFFLEATVVFPRDPREEHRMQLFLESLTDLKSKHFDLMIWENSEQFPVNMPDARKLKREVKNWFQTLDWQLVKENYENCCLKGEVATDKLPKRIFTFEKCKWSIEFTAFPRDEKDIENGVDRITRGYGTGIHENDISQRIKKSVSAKGKKYRKLDAPLVVAVNIMKWNAGRDDVERTLFGVDGVKYKIVGNSFFHDGEYRDTRGASFRIQEGIPHDWISGLLYGTQVGLHNFDNAPLTLIRNPLSYWTPPRILFGESKEVSSYGNLRYECYELGEKTIEN